MRRLLILACFSLATMAHAQAARVPSDYKRLLLPFHVSAASGSGQWAVQWWFRNEGDAPVDAFPLAIFGGLPPPPGPDGPAVFILGKPSLPPRTTVNTPASDALPSILVPPFVPVVSSAPGAFLYVEKSAARVTVGGAVQWTARPRERSAGAAALQAIPEEAFLSGTASIMPVIVDANRRYAIRLYALPETIAQSPRVRVRVFDMQPITLNFPSEELHATFDVELRVPVSRVRPCINACDVPAVTYVPAVAEVFGLAAGFEHKPLPPATRVEITPESPSLRWWAVVSATDNDTHDITVYQPPLYQQ